jgi:hypothetical protein
MKIGLTDVDGRNYPNLALMKISAFHKLNGDQVQWYNPWEHHDVVYQSKVFTFTSDYDLYLNVDCVHKGGTGYGYGITLPEDVDAMTPDYSIYPKYKEAYGFLTRGCPNKCSFCIVPQKEGDIVPYADIDDFRDGRGDVILMDNNVLAHEHGLSQIEKIIDLGLKVDFNQGLDARIISQNESIAELLSGVKWLKPLRMACDTKGQMKYVEEATRLLRKHNTTPKNFFVYLLVKDVDDALERAEFLRGLGLDPFAQPFRDFTNNTEPTSEQKRFARWVNHKAIFKSVEFKDYR